MNKTYIVTGASSGIGNAIALDLLNQNDQVIGVSRSVPSNLEIPYYPCDLSNQEEVNSVFQTIVSEHPEIDGIIHVAGMGIAGALEFASNEDVLYNFLVNVFSIMQINQIILPILRMKKCSNIIIIGSVAGPITIPFQTVYSMTKRSIQTYAEGLRLEVKPFGIKVTTVLPGDTLTNFPNTRKKITVLEDEFYEKRVIRSIKKMEHDEQKGVSPHKVSKVVLAVLKKNKPPVHKTVGLNYKTLMVLSKLLPIRLVQWVVYKLYGK